MKKIYIVMKQSWDNINPLIAFETKENADTFLIELLKNSNGTTYWIEEVLLEK